MASSGISQVVRKSRALGPSVRNLLTQYKLDLSQITSTGPHQTILKSDVMAYISQKNLKPGAFAGTKVYQVPRDSSFWSKYARKYPTQLEIDVINGGGIAAT